MADRRGGLNPSNAILHLPISTDNALAERPSESLGIPECINRRPRFRSRMPVNFEIGKVLPTHFQDGEIDVWITGDHSHD